MVSIYHDIGVSPGRGSYDQAMAANYFIQKTREKLANFFNAPDPNRVIFTANATDGLNLAILGMVKAGDHVITTRLEHNSVLRPLFHLQQTQNITTALLPFDEKGFVDPQAFHQAIISYIQANSCVQSKANSKTKVDTKINTDPNPKSDVNWGFKKSGNRSKPTLMIINHASNVLGTVQPVDEIGEICSNYGIPLLVDASQSAGLLPVNMGRMKASAMVFTGHKSLYGPTGIGGLILHPDLEIQSTQFGGTGMESKSLIHTQTFPQRLEAGTHNLMGIIGLSLALDNLMELGVKKIHKREMALAQMLYQGLKTIPGVTLYGGSSLDNTNPCGSQDRHVPLFSVNMDGIDPEDLGAILDGDFNIAVRVGLHCAPLVHESMGTGDRGAVRFSLGRFNTEDDVQYTIDAMSRIAMMQNQ